MHCFKRETDWMWKNFATLWKFPQVSGMDYSISATVLLMSSVRLDRRPRRGIDISLLHFLRFCWAASANFRLRWNLSNSLLVYSSSQSSQCLHNENGSCFEFCCKRTALETELILTYIYIIYILTINDLLLSSACLINGSTTRIGLLIDGLLLYIPILLFKDKQKNL